LGTTLSPNGRIHATLVAEENPEARNYTQKILWTRTQSCRPERSLSKPREISFHGSSPDASFQFSPEGKALAFVVEEKGVHNIWLQRLDGSNGQQMTNFKSEEIAAVRWSPAAKQLAVVRHHNSSDVILLREPSVTWQ
jgi:Tol biopolymer transport system component